MRSLHVGTFYDDKETRVMVNQSVNEFFTRLLFKIDELPQDVGLPLNIATIWFNKLIPGVRKLFIPEGVKFPQRLPAETNHQGNQRLLLIRNAAVKAEQNIITIEDMVQPVSGIRHPRKFMGTFGKNPVIKMAGLGSSFQYEENNYMLAEALE